MAAPTTSSSLNLQHERLRVRAVELRRQQQVLQNELESPGIGAEQATFLRQRMATLSTEEESIGTKIAQAERSLSETRQKESDTRTEQSVTQVTGRPGTLVRQQAVAIAKRLRTVARQRILELQRNFQQQRKSDNIDELEKIQEPIWWAFGSVLIAGFAIDAINIFLWYFGVGVGALAAIVIGVFVGAFMFLVIRAFINRGPLASIALSCCLLMGGMCIIVFGFLVIPAIIGMVLFIPVAIAGIWNPGAKIVSVSKKDIQKRIQTYERKIQQVQKIAAKINKYVGIIAEDSAIFTKALPFAEGISAFLGWIPWQSMTIVMTYWSLKKHYRETQALLAQYKQAQSEALQAEIASVQANLNAQLTGFGRAPQIVSRARELRKEFQSARAADRLSRDHQEAIDENLTRETAKNTPLPTPSIQKSIPTALPAAA